MPNAILGLNEQINQNFDKYISLFGTRKNEIISILNTLPDNLHIYFKKLITQTVATDLISIELNDLVKHLYNFYNTITNIGYCKNISYDILLDYVLPYRINDENFELYSTVFYQELKDIIVENDIKQTALNVNYWCYSKATYHQADDRTQNALTTIKSGFGRCGEESTLLVSALRSVGIPARQCYCPYWSHCDDNHAWVEVYTGDKWEFMGACEPEEELNIGWFNFSASRAGIIRHRLLEFSDREINSCQNNIFTTKASTDTYTTTRKFSVIVKEKSTIINNVNVGVYVINYGMPKLLIEKTTNNEGKADFELGLGNYILYCFYNGNWDMKTYNIDNNCENIITLDISYSPSKVNFNLVPFDGILPQKIVQSSDVHYEKLKELRYKRVLSHKYANENQNKYIKLSQLNNKEIEEFSNTNELSKSDEYKKELILSTLTEKDFTDIKYASLLDMFDAFDCQNKFDDDIFAKYLLPLRVENEPLYPYKQYVKDFFINKNICEPNDILNYVNKFIKLLDDYCYPNVVGDIKSTLKYNISSSKNIPIHIVQILRSLGYPSRLSPIDKSVEYYNGKEFISLNKNSEKTYSIKLNSKNIIDKENVNIKICKYEHNSINEVFNDTQLIEKKSINLNQGLYVITESYRQIDGANTGTLFLEYIDRNIENGQKEIVFDDIADETEQKLKSINVPYSLNKGYDKYIIAYVNPSSEPTEHFFNEIIENVHLLNKYNIKIFIYSESYSTFFDNYTNIKDTLITYELSEFNKDWVKLRNDMQIGDLRLPFITAIKNNKYIYSFANYNIGTIATLVKLLKY